MVQNPLNLVSRSAAALLKAGLETLAGAERQGSSLFHAIVGNGKDDRDHRERAHENGDEPASAWALLEAFFDHRIARALNALQIPTSDDIHELTQRVEVLTDKVAKLQAEQAMKPVPARKRATTKRAIKPSPRKKRAQSAPDRG